MSCIFLGLAHGLLDLHSHTSGAGYSLSLCIAVGSLSYTGLSFLSPLNSLQLLVKVNMKRIAIKQHCSKMCFFISIQSGSSC